jgi:hypothetical protein
MAPSLALRAWSKRTSTKSSRLMLASSCPRCPHPVPSGYVPVICHYPRWFPIVCGSQGSFAKLRLRVRKGSVKMATRIAAWPAYAPSRRVDERDPCGPYQARAGEQKLAEHAALRRGQDRGHRRHSGPGHRRAVFGRNLALASGGRAKDGPQRWTG